MLTRSQNALYWREWSAAKRALMLSASPARTRETWTKLEENTRRHEITIRALGADKSHVDFTNAEFDQVLGELRAISKPGDLNAQLRQVRGAHRRAEWSLDRLMRKLGVDRNYVQGIVDQMFEPVIIPASFAMWDRERRRTTAPRKLLDKLTESELKKVIIALRKQLKRQREPAEVAPF